MTTIFKYQNTKSESNEMETKLLTRIFKEVLPRKGMAFRKKQLELSLKMLSALQERKIALCEAEVGTGKTHAYILAVIIHNLFQENKVQAIISTSTIALQKALTEEYLPQISSILMSEGILNRNISFAVRKGKAHYACYIRVKGYKHSLLHNQYPDDAELIQILANIENGTEQIDLDKLPLTDYVKNRICVDRCKRKCSYASICRYQRFIKNCMTVSYDFQIANHNYILADLLAGKFKKNRLLPQYEIIIFDEAHKIVEAARQMYGINFEAKELERLSVSIFRALDERNEDKDKALILCQEIMRINHIFFQKITEAIPEESNNRTPVYFTNDILQKADTLKQLLQKLSVLFCTPVNKVHYNHKQGLYERIFNRIQEKVQKIDNILKKDKSVFWLERMSAGGYEICAIPKQLGDMLQEDLWSKDISMILTSGTISVSGDFSHFKRNSGLQESVRAFIEVSYTSPFDYVSHALLYIPDNMPFPNPADIKYMDAIAEQIELLIHMTKGHTLVLFTSYRMMEKSFLKLEKKVKCYPLFMMGKGKINVIDEFRRSGNGVLFASDSAGEGIDLAGDILSSVIVVKLPFPIPDAISEYEQSLYDNFYDYLNECIVPAMLIKLRQWIGRGIRRESDTAVFSILDSRAGSKGQYRNAVLSALPDMPVTSSVTDVGRFISEMKSDDYFF